MNKKIIFYLTIAVFIIFGSIDTADAYTVHPGTFTDPSGMTFGTYIGGGEGYGYADPTSYAWNGNCKAGAGNCFSKNGNARDWYWIQDTDGPNNPDPLTGLQYDLGGQANKVVVFPIIDHGPIGPESWEYNVYLSNDQITWTSATLIEYYLEGWTSDPNISDGYTTVWALDSGMTARYVSVTAGNNGNPDFSFYFTSFDNEIDAVAGLTESGGGLNTVPEPSTYLLLGSGIAGLALWRRKRQAMSQK